MNAPNCPDCPDCAVPMKRGFIPDATYGSFLTTRWHPGDPKKTSFLGVDTGTKVNLSATSSVVAYRCAQCTLLRFYAPQE